MRRSSAWQRVALSGAIALGLAVTGGVMSALVRVPETPGTASTAGSARHAAPLTGNAPISTPASPRTIPASAAPVRALAATTPAATSAPAPPPPAPQVHLTAPAEAVSLPAGTELVLDLAGTAASPWSAPSDGDPSVLRPLTVVAGPLSLHAVYLGVRPGTAVLEVDRLAICSSAAPAGICAAQAFRITVTVTAG